MERMTFEPLPGDLFENPRPFKPIVFYNNRLRMLCVQSKDCSILEVSATRLHALSVSYSMRPIWWKRLFGMAEVVGIEIYDPDTYAKEYGFQIENLFPLVELVKAMSEDSRLEFTWSAREKRRVLRYLKRRDFMIDLARLFRDFCG